MCPVHGRCVQVADHSVGRDGQRLDRIRSEGSRQRRFGLGPAEHPVLRRASHGNPDTACVLGDEDTGQSEARSRLQELLVVRALRHREPHLGDDLAVIQGGLEHPLEVVISADGPAVGDDGGPRAQCPRWVASRRVVVGQAAADCAPVAHRRIADHRGEARKSGIAGRGVVGDLSVGCRAADADLARIVGAHTNHLADGTQAHQGPGRGEALLHRWKECLSPAKRLGLIARKGRYRVGDGSWFHEIEVVHGRSP